MRLLVLPETTLLQTFLLSGVFTVTKLPYWVLVSKISLALKINTWGQACLSRHLNRGVLFDWEGTRLLRWHRSGTVLTGWESGDSVGPQGSWEFKEGLERHTALLFYKQDHFY